VAVRRGLSDWSGSLLRGRWPGSAALMRTASLVRRSGGAPPRLGGSGRTPPADAHALPSALAGVASWDAGGLCSARRAT
jgi:hypothetical protein